jgi:transposase
LTDHARRETGSITSAQTGRVALRGDQPAKELIDSADALAAVGEVAELLRVSVPYVSKALTRHRTTGETSARTQRSHKPLKLAPFYAAIREYVAEHGDTTIERLRGWLLATHQIKASVGLVWHTLRLLGLTRKKSRSGPPSKIGRMSRRHARNGARASQRLTQAS